MILLFMGGVISGEDIQHNVGTILLWVLGIAKNFSPSECLSYESQAYLPNIQENQSKFID